MPTKKLGADWPTKAPNIANRSMMVLRFMAAMIPAGMPTMIAMASATLASSSEQLGHRPVVVHRFAEVSLEKLSDVVEILPDDGVVQPVVFTKCIERGGRCVRPEHGLGRVA